MEKDAAAYSLATSNKKEKKRMGWRKMATYKSLLGFQIHQSSHIHWDSSLFFFFFYKNYLYILQSRIPDNQSDHQRHKFPNQFPKRGILLGRRILFVPVMPLELPSPLGPAPSFELSPQGSLELPSPLGPAPS